MLRKIKESGEAGSGGAWEVEERTINLKQSQEEAGLAMEWVIWAHQFEIAML